MDKRVLIVDDHAAFRHNVSRYLGMLDGGYVPVGEAGTVHEALQCIEQVHPEIVLMDIELPDGDGLLVTEYIHQQWPAIQVIVMSGNDAREYRQCALNIGASGYVDKLDLFAALPLALADAAKVVTA